MKYYVTIAEVELAVKNVSLELPAYMLLKEEDDKWYNDEDKEVKDLDKVRAAFEMAIGEGIIPISGRVYTHLADMRKCYRNTYYVDYTLGAGNFVDKGVEEKIEKDIIGRVRTLRYEIMNLYHEECKAVADKFNGVR